jgi:hypothetical protein
MTRCLSSLFLRRSGQRMQHAQLELPNRANLVDFEPFEVRAPTIKSKSFKCT